METPLFSIFTPTYNRANTIGRTYEHLVAQTLPDFEWIVIDDGSTDDTENLFRKWIAEDKIRIVYEKRPNGGKHRAFNRAVEIARGEIFVCMDSDDYYRDDALAVIRTYHSKHGNNPLVAGFSCNSLDMQGELIGTSVPEDGLLVSHYDLYHSFGVKGDKGLIYYTRILREFPFPEFANEKFVTEAVVLNRISRHYQLCCIRQGLEFKEYQKDGLTSAYARICLRSPEGYALYLNELNYFRQPFFRYVVYASCYVKFGLLAHKSLKTLWQEAINRRWTFVGAVFLGCLLWLRDKDKR